MGEDETTGKKTESQEKFTFLYDHKVRRRRLAHSEMVHQTVFHTHISLLLTAKFEHNRLVLQTPTRIFWQEKLCLFMR